MKRKGEWLELILPRELRPDAGGPARAEKPGGVHEPALCRESGRDARALIESWLAERLGMPAGFIRQLFGEGGVRTEGSRIRLRLFPEREWGFSPWWYPLDVLYEDDFCLVVDKPAGLAVHPDGSGTGEGTLAGAVAFHYEATGQLTAVRHIHRLDRMTSGPVLYAKNAFAQAKLDEQMRQKKIERLYLAAVRGIPKSPAGRIRAPIGKDRHEPGKRRVSPGGKAAVTRYELVEAFPSAGASLLRLRLETGRTHQVRVHLSHIGHPIIGDELYGEPDPRIGRQALHGELLRFFHPLTNEEVTVLSPLPGDFAALLASLRSPGG